MMDMAAMLVDCACLVATHRLRQRLDAMTRASNDSKADDLTAQACMADLAPVHAAQAAAAPDPTTYDLVDDMSTNFRNITDDVLEELDKAVVNWEAPSIQRAAVMLTALTPVSEASTPDVRLPSAAVERNAVLTDLVLEEVGVDDLQMQPTTGQLTAVKHLSVPSVGIYETDGQLVSASDVRSAISGKKPAKRADREYERAGSDGACSRRGSLPSLSFLQSPTPTADGSSEHSGSGVVHGRKRRRGHKRDRAAAEAALQRDGAVRALIGPGRARGGDGAVPGVVSAAAGKQRSGGGAHLRDSAGRLTRSSGRRGSHDRHDPNSDATNPTSAAARAVSAQAARIRTLRNAAVGGVMPDPLDELDGAPVAGANSGRTDEGDDEGAMQIMSPSDYPHIISPEALAVYMRISMTRGALLAACSGYWLLSQPATSFVHALTESLMSQRLLVDRRLAGSVPYAPQGIPSALGEKWSATGRRGSNAFAAGNALSVSSSNLLRSNRVTSFMSRRMSGVFT